MASTPASSCSQDGLDTQLPSAAIYGSCPRYEKRGESSSPCGGGGFAGRLPPGQAKWERCSSYSPSSSLERMTVDSPLTAGGGGSWTPPILTASSLMVAGSPRIERVRGRSPLSGEDSASVLSFSLRYSTGQYPVVQHYEKYIFNVA